MILTKGDKWTMAIYTAACLLMAAIVVVPNAKEHLVAALEFCGWAILPAYLTVWIIVLLTKPNKNEDIHGRAD